MHASIRRAERHTSSTLRAFVRVAAVAIVAVVGATSDAHAAPEKRELPDYDGRGGEPKTPGDVALWVPRTALAPLWLVAEYGLRRPLGAMIADAERAHVPEALYNFFFFGPDHKAGFAPVAFVDFGFNPSFGLYAFWDDAFFKGHDLRFHGSAWGDEWLAGIVTESFRFRHDDMLTLRLAGIRRPDLVFFGIGPDTRQSMISRFGEDRFEASALVELPLWRASRVEASVAVRSVDLHHGHYARDPSLEQEAATGAFAIPYGFDRGYTAQASRLYGALDTRLPRPAPGSGFCVELEAEEGADVRRSPGSAWLRYGATAGAFLDLNGRNRVLSISATTRFADALGQSPIPFPELVSLGGVGPMRGYYPGRLVDRSAIAAMVEYRWPIWVWLDGSVQAATGNVFGSHLDGFEASRLRLSGAVGIESVGSGDGSFELLIGVGTETFDQNAKLDSVRIALGTNRGF